METTAIEKVEQTALTWPEKAAAINIVDQASYNFAAETLLEIAKLEKEVKAHHGPIKTAAHDAHKAAVAGEKRFLDPLDKAKSLIRRAISGWEIKQRRIREEAERKAREEAEKKEEEDRIARAIEAEKAGKSTEEVEKIIDTPAEVKIEPVKPTYKPAPGVSTRETWKAEVTDIKALCKAVADGTASEQSVLPNMPVLNASARTAKESFSIPGVKAIKEVNVVTR